MLYELTVPQFCKTLRNLSAFLTKGSEYAETKKFDVEVLFSSRLAPDQFNFIRQVQIACDTAKLGLFRLTGKEAPKHEDNEKTLLDLKKRIDETVGYLNSITPKDLEGSLDKKITHPRWEGKHLIGSDFVTQYLIPNFYFHITTAYSIFRHNGVDLGKKDYLGELPFRS